jgi:hypothetical protein
MGYLMIIQVPFELYKCPLWNANNDFYMYCMWNRVDKALELLDSEYSIDIDYGLTLACICGHFAFAELLCKRGAVVNLKRKHTSTHEHYDLPSTDIKSLSNLHKKYNNANIMAYIFRFCNYEYLEYTKFYQLLSALSLCDDMISAVLKYINIQKPCNVVSPWSKGPWTGFLVKSSEEFSSDPSEDLPGSSFKVSFESFVKRYSLEIFTGVLILFVISK